jgi:hypothetical protein
MISLKASEIKPGQRIVLDMGYGHPMDEVCAVITVQQGRSLFDAPVIRFRVRRPGGEIVNVVDYKPDDKVEVPDGLL